MNIIQTEIAEVLVVEPTVYNDARGFFFESYNEKTWQETLQKEVRFVQTNHSRSMRNVLRGLHYQIKNPQGKLVRVIVGEIFDVAVDLRSYSATFGKWVGFSLSAKNKKQMWIPEGFAHGFYVVSDFAEILYMTTDFYAPEHERSIIWNDPDLAIAWPETDEVILSEKDKKASFFKNSEYFQ